MARQPYGWPVPASTSRRQAAQVIAALRAGTIPRPGHGLGVPAARVQARPVPAIPAGGWHGSPAGLVFQRRPRILGLGQYRGVQGIPLQPGNAQAAVASASSLNITPVFLGSATAASGTTLTVPLSPSTTAGQTIVVLVGSSQVTTNPTVSAVKLGALADNFAPANTAYLNGTVNAAIWIDPNCAGGQSSVVITLTGGSGASPAVGAFVYAVPNLTASPLDAHPAGGNSTGSSWTTAATGGLAQPAEVAFGIVAASAAAATITPPGAPWVSQPQITAAALIRLVASYQVLSSAASLAYAGTLSASTIFGTSMITLEAASSGGPTPGTAACQLGPAGLGNLWYPSQVTLATSTGILSGQDSSVANLYLGPSVSPATLLGQVFGGQGIVAAALPNIQPGEFLIAQWTGANPGDTAIMNIQGSMDALV